MSEIVNECLEEMHAGEVWRVTIHPCQELQDHLKKFHTTEQLAVDYQIELITFEKVLKCVPPYILVRNLNKNVAHFNTSCRSLNIAQQPKYVSAHSWKEVPGLVRPDCL